MKHKGSSLLADVAVTYAIEGEGEFPKSSIEEMKKTFLNLIAGLITDEECQNIIKNLHGNDSSVLKIREILSIEDQPRSHSHSKDTSNSNEEGQRKRAKLWNANEDKRLIAAIYRFSLNDWISVSKFVGNGRNRSQCSQRWFRCLDPKIEKSKWNNEEDERLKELVSIFGDHSWAKVASKMGTRSDVQCRYRWFHFLSDSKLKQKNSNEDSLTDEEEILIDNNKNEEIHKIFTQTGNQITPDYSAPPEQTFHSPPIQQEFVYPTYSDLFFLSF